MKFEFWRGDTTQTRTGAALPWAALNQELPGVSYYGPELIFNGGPLDAPEMIARGGIEVCDIADRKVAFASDRRQ